MLGCASGRGVRGKADSSGEVGGELRSAASLSTGALTFLEGAGRCWAGVFAAFFAAAFSSLIASAAAASRTSSRAGLCAAFLRTRSMGFAVLLVGSRGDCGDGVASTLLLGS